MQALAGVQSVLGADRAVGLAEPTQSMSNAEVLCSRDCGPAAFSNVTYDTTDVLFSLDYDRGAGAQ